MFVASLEFVSVIVDVLEGNEAPAATAEIADNTKARVAHTRCAHMLIMC